MNNITRIAANLTLATGIAAAALTLGATAAQAETPNGPGQFQLAPETDPEGPKLGIPTPKPEPKPAPDLELAPKPEPKPDPKPQFETPDEITDKPGCTHGCGGGNEVPDDAAPAPETKDDEPTDDPANDAPLDQGCFTGCDLPEQDTAPVEDQDILTPTRVDAGQDAAEAKSAFSTSSSDETGLAYYVGLGLVSIAGAFGVAFAARRFNRKQADQA